mmetsp:Transcript_6355/g.16955  ORF Transcript_6355/g.16955 Transcript_6355/m.16955 type:complete len:80 (-) Transcript_6355:386-625(-)
MKWSSANPMSCILPKVRGLQTASKCCGCSRMSMSAAITHLANPYELRDIPKRERTQIYARFQYAPRVDVAVFDLSCSSM